MLKDRIEILDKNYNVYTHCSEDKKRAISVIYMEFKSYCKVIYYTFIDLDNKLDRETQLKSLHNTVLAKLFKAVRDSKKENKSVEKLLNEHNTDNLRHSDKNNNDKHWIKYCKEYLPDYVEICCLIEEDYISCYEKDEPNKMHIKRVKSIIWPIKEHMEKIQKIIGSIENTFYSDGNRHYFYYLLDEKKCIGIVSRADIPIGRQLKEIEKFAKGTMDRGYCASLQS